MNWLPTGPAPRARQRFGGFRHVVVDYPLAQAVADGIVKTPVIGEVSGATVELGDTSFQRNRQWLDVAVKERATGLMFIRVHPRLDRIRQDHRYPALLRRVGLDTA